MNTNLTLYNIYTKLAQYPYGAFNNNIIYVSESFVNNSIYKIGLVQIHLAQKYLIIFELLLFELYYLYLLCFLNITVGAVKNLLLLTINYLE